MEKFQTFAQAIHARYQQLTANELFIAGTNRHAVSDTYLAAFPEGTNLLYKTNTEHDCSCCKNFIRNLGNVVAIVDGQVQTVWDAPGLEYPYDVVAKAMHDYILAQPITSLFRTAEGQYGTALNHQNLGEGQVKTWHHFHGKVAPKHLTQDAATQIGTFNTTAHLFKRGLEELKPEAFTQVIELIDAKALYRGEEHSAAVVAFSAYQVKYQAMSPEAKNLFLWTNANAPFARFRNTVIGTLVQDLSDGVDMDQAVRSFEAKVAPANYKRPTALITPGMIKTAMATITELGLEPALERRFARISDVSVNNVLWVDNTVQPLMKDGIESLLKMAVKPAPVKDVAVQEISIADFMTNVLPTAASMELLVKGSNFMSFTAPIHDDVPQLFKWGNNFAWSYDGNVADSIKDRVGKAGGNITNAKLRVSLAWSNFDDLDIYCTEPNGNTICFHNKSGKLDVDMNAGGGRSRTPVENISWVTLADGAYNVWINQYCQRETSDVGCTVEIENAGKITQLSYPKAVKGNVAFCTIRIERGVITGLTVPKDITSSGISLDKWSVKTETFAKVNTLMYSPNYWDGEATGNKHWFFILDGCRNPEPTRGIYNEFLHSRLEPHRKVFEVLGDKTKCQPTDDQLSGLGFSSTRGDTVTVKVAGRLLNINF